MLDSPVYAGAYAFGKTRQERYVDEHGTRASGYVASPKQNGAS